MDPNLNQPEVVEVDDRSKLSRFWAWLTAFRHWSWKKRLLVFVPLLIVVSLATWAIFFRQQPSTTSSQSVASAPATVASPLTGLQVDPALAKRPVTAVMIENSLDARPQSGLESAGVVFEAVAEGGITRFSALFQEAQPSLVGPVRSVRPYYMDWVAGFQASVAHVGGSPDGLKKVRGGMRDLDEFFNPNYYWRSGSRAAPHNVYTSFAKLNALNKAKGYKTSTFDTWARKADAPLTTPTAKTVNLSMSGYYYDVNYVYVASSNSYYRREGGQKHMDVTASGKQVWLHPKVVIAMVVPLGAGKLDAQSAAYSNYADIGSGRAYIFQDGGVTGATWVKKSMNGQLIFIDADNKQIPLNAGQTWITAVSAKTAVGYSAK